MKVLGAVLLLFPTFSVKNSFSLEISGFISFLVLFFILIFVPCVILSCVIYSSPTAMDAYVFGRLWPLLNYDRTCRKHEASINHRLISHIYQCENLLNLCRRVQRLCFPAAAKTMRSCELLFRFNFSNASIRRE